MNKFIRNTALAAGLCLASSFSAMTSVASPQGHIDFDDLSNVYGEPKVEINLGATLIGMVSAFSAQEDPEVAALLKKLEFVKVRVYSLNKGTAKHAFETVESVTKALRKDRWEPIVSVNEEGEKVRIFTKLTDGIIDGLVVMAVSSGEGGEAVFINIVGEIDPAQVSKVTESLNVDVGLGGKE